MIAAARFLGDNAAVGVCRPGIARPAPSVVRASGAAGRRLPA